MSPQTRIVTLHAIAHGRAGDKGNVCNVSVIAYQPDGWPIIDKQVTAERVRGVFEPYGVSRVERYALPQLRALNFVIRDGLGGGVNSSLALDRHGKAMSFLLLGALEVEIASDLVHLLAGREAGDASFP